MNIKTTIQICDLDDETKYCEKDTKWVKVDDVKELITKFPTNNRTQRNILKKLLIELERS